MINTEDPTIIYLILPNYRIQSINLFFCSKENSFQEINGTYCI